MRDRTTLLEQRTLQRKSIDEQKRQIAEKMEKVRQGKVKKEDLVIVLVL